jgi:hypothetical protein
MHLDRPRLVKFLTLKKIEQSIKLDLIVTLCTVVDAFIGKMYKCRPKPGRTQTAPSPAQKTLAEDQEIGGN